MFGYWLAVLRWLALPALAVGVLCGGAMAAVMLVGDGAPWGEALGSAAGAGAAAALALALVLSTVDTAGAARTARRYGLVLGPEAVGLPYVREVRVPGVGKRTAYQLTDSVRHAVERTPALRLDEVTAFGHGKLDLALRGPSGTGITARVRVDVGPEGAVAVVETSPAASYKRLDGAGCWAVGQVLARRVEDALRAEVEQPDAVGGQ
ncbi:hypothetical protein AB0D49_28880 [Streptomyces sp. NPDC048290]|uniref:hypothetical protein n=1 Tax=Streptomyces sp. NPDC048290 TaxID=3155811 RepID=UPI00342EF517